jgi:periplasmic protein TonB
MKFPFLLKNSGINHTCIVSIALAFSFPVISHATIPSEKSTMKIETTASQTVSVIQDSVLTVADKMPQFPGGESALMSFIAMNLHYPPIDGCGFQGKVIIRFIITKSGDVSHVEVIRSFDPACDKEAITVIKKLPRWIPGEHNEKKVAVYYTIPIVFKME